MGHALPPPGAQHDDATADGTASGRLRAIVTGCEVGAQHDAAAGSAFATGAGAQHEAVSATCATAGAQQDSAAGAGAQHAAVSPFASGRPASPNVGIDASVWKVSQAMPCGSVVQYLSDSA
jgi:hypothetical protein